jgi:hypothetical protein
MGGEVCSWTNRTQTQAKARVMTHTPMSVVFTRVAINEMGAEPFMGLIAASIHRDVWDMNSDSLIFYITEESWIWLLLKHPELARSRWVPDPKP